MSIGLGALAAAVNALLPQTQCTRCGYQGCEPYAAAVASGAAAINRCPPGGTATVLKLSQLMGCETLALDPACGVEAAPTVAWIDADRCIGCARCLPPCPVDAIVGAQRLLHSVIDSMCTGCELCLPVCPVDCIHMLPRPVSGLQSITPTATDNRLRYEAHQQRHRHQQQTQQALLAERKRAAPMKSRAE